MTLLHASGKRCSRMLPPDWYTASSALDTHQPHDFSSGQERPPGGCTSKQVVVLVSLLLVSCRLGRCCGSSCTIAMGCTTACAVRLQRLGLAREMSLLGSRVIWTTSALHQVIKRHRRCGAHGHRQLLRAGCAQRQQGECKRHIHSSKRRHSLRSATGVIALVTVVLHANDLVSHTGRGTQGRALVQLTQRPMLESTAGRNGTHLCHHEAVRPCAIRFTWILRHPNQHQAGTLQRCTLRR